tara:strand:+ start:664 stop:1173 length:510 start_codon:yes stop_codon:yes gene_type:complete
MKHLILLFTFALLLIAPIQVANSQSKVAHIDVQKLITDMPEVIAAQKELEKLQKTYTTDIQNTIKELQVKQQTYSADAANQTEITNQARAEELQAMQQNIQKFEQTAAQDLQKKQQDMMSPLIEKARAAIEKVAAAQGFDYVLDATPGGFVIMAKGKDLLVDVKNELGF